MSYNYDQEMFGESLDLTYCPYCRKVEVFLRGEVQGRCECGLIGGQRRIIEYVGKDGLEFKDAGKRSD